MTPLFARTGRERQRYENNYRLVAGCIPYRIVKDADDTTDALKFPFEILMISSPNRQDLVFPKGGWENDETVHEAASREALEEAGVRGTLDVNLLGSWVFRSKSKQNSCSLEGACKGYMFALNVTEELNSWPEEAIHQRKWLPVGEAYRYCRYDWMREALDACILHLLKEKLAVGELPSYYSLGLLRGVAYNPECTRSRLGCSLS